MKYLEKRSSLAAQALKKLSPEEVGALLSTTTDITSYKRHDDKKLAKLKKHIAEMEAKMAERMKVRWMAADGKTFDNYNEYSNHQWGTNFPPSDF